MMDSRAERVKKVSEMFSKSRYEGGKTQEFMAFEMGVSKKTIMNWENGTSCPSMFQFAEWFRILNINPMNYLLTMLYPNLYEKTGQNASDEEIEKAFDEMCKQMPISDKRAWLFVYTGKHGSSSHSLIQLLLAHLHTPLTTRVTQADAICNVYEMHKDLETLICKDDIMPDTEDLERARKLGRIAVMNKEYGYSILEKTEGQK